MFRNIALLLAVSLWSCGSLLLPQEVLADTALTRAVIESLRNQARLIPKNQSPRQARPSDRMTPGDSLATARASMAQLRFNDGSLARLGEQAVFQFAPGTRTLNLSNGTALVLIPPRQGTTRVRTPNAAAGIRGSALFVRYLPETDTTIVGALTNSHIEVSNQTGSQRQELKAGNMAVVVKDRIEKVYEFDLRTFYKTSDLASGLDLTRSQPMPSTDAAIAQVQEETSDALKAQSPVIGERVIENPDFIQLSASRSQDFPNVEPGVIDSEPSSRQQSPGSFRNTSGNTMDVRSLLERGEIRDNQIRNRFPGGGATGGNFPGGGATGGNFPGRGNGNGGTFPGGGATGGNFPGGGATGGNFPGGGATGGNFPGGGATGGNFPGGGATGGTFPGGGATGGNFPGGGA
ncbi:MAG TPA: FecR domain-containing protein, partial [Waterburya sp.]